MPPKSHKKLRGRAKEDTLVTSRLMTIRLLVDDYIYKNKPISLLEAIKFNKEISSLKLKCQQDTRSLQVVERLKILMKSIIKEQTIDEQDNSSGFVAASSVENNSLANSLTSKDNNSVIVSNVSEDVENDVNNNNEANTTIDFFNNRDNQDTEANNITEDITNQKKIDIIHPEISVINNDVTQFESNKLILSNNFYLRLNNDDLPKPANDVEEAEPGLVMLETNLQKLPEKEKSCLNQEIKKSNEKQVKSNKFIPPYNSSLSLNNDFNIDDLAKPTKNKPEEQDPVMLTTNLQKEQQERSFIEDIKKINEIATETRNNKNQTEANKRTTNIKIPVKKNIKTKTNKVINSSSKEENKSGVNKTRNKRKEKKQANLSWVENIKYVREVTPDEHTHLQTDDSFWNNLTLPRTWNSNEFDET